jgi:general stress protein CsbA
MTAPQSRPRVVTAAFWCWVAAAIMLIVGGLIAASVSALPAVYRGGGIITVLAGGGIAYLAGRSRNEDTRYRRAAIALSLVIVVLVAIASVLGFTVHVLTLLAVLPLIAGTVLMTRPAAAPEQESR